MYGGKGGGGPILGLVPTVAGAVVLPNTGDNHLLRVVSIVSIVAGCLIIAASLALFAAKKAHKA
jgi:hypothetical protein